MSRDKQIEEMAKQLYGNFGLTMPTARNVAKYLTEKKGYRKATEVARAIFADFTKNKVCTNEEDWSVLNELKKKYTGVTKR